ncbi:MAG: hypothetical protein V4685_00355 [Bacteroidota bacterium]
MRKILFLAALTSLIQISCKKDASPGPTATSLDGKWRMIIVKDKASGLITTKPASLQRDIEITFTSTSTTAGTFNGHTPANLIDNSPFSTGTDQSMSINFLMMTKVGEEPWGNFICK